MKAIPSLHVQIEREKLEYIFLKVWELPHAEKMRAISSSYQKGQ